MQGSHVLQFANAVVVGCQQARAGVEPQKRDGPCTTVASSSWDGQPPTQNLPKLDVFEWVVSRGGGCGVKEQRVLATRGDLMFGQHLCITRLREASGLHSAVAARAAEDRVLPCPGEPPVARPTNPDQSIKVCWQWGQSFGEACIVLLVCLVLSRALDWAEPSPVKALRTAFGTIVLDGFPFITNRHLAVGTLEILPFGQEIACGLVSRQLLVRRSAPTQPCTGEVLIARQGEGLGFGTADDVDHRLSLSAASPDVGQAAHPGRDRRLSVH